MITRRSLHGLVLVIAYVLYGCSQPDTGKPDVHADWWITTGDEKKLLEKQEQIVSSIPDTNNMDIIVDTVYRYQAIDGFGYTLTGGSAQLMNAMEPSAKRELLQELFGKNGIRVSYLRISVGASDLNPDVFTYDDMVMGQTDPELKNFSLEKDKAGGTGLIPLLREILAINPKIQILASPWTAPVWMKSNKGSVGGSLMKEYYKIYADYLVKYVQQMKAEGISIDAMTLQNEPLHGGNNPSMVMLAEEQAVFIGQYVGPAFRNAGIKTKIIVYDHNCNKPEYPITVLNDSIARIFVDGSAFHLYEGDISALSEVRKAHPDKNLYFTEQWTGSKGSFEGDLNWHVKNVVIGSTRNWSRIALEWNLANSPEFGPHTPGGCTECKGAITISTTTMTRNVAYYIIAHASKFVPVGSKRIESSGPTTLSNVAFLTPEGQMVLIVQNENTDSAKFNIHVGDRSLKSKLPPRSVATYVIVGNK